MDLSVDRSQLQTESLRTLLQSLCSASSLAEFVRASWLIRGRFPTRKLG
jgi:hypothetical protein